MERLTIRVDNGLEEIYFYNPDDPEGVYTLSDIAKNGHDDICVQIANRLAAYEDTGLTPEEVHRLKAKYEALESDKNVIESSLINAEMNLEAQQQEIEQLKEVNRQLMWENISDNMSENITAEQAEQIKALTADKDEQAGRIMKLEDGLKCLHDLLEEHVPNWYLRKHHEIAIDALLGGAES